MNKPLIEIEQQRIICENTIKPKKKRIQRQCAVCGDRSTVNVIFKWKRYSDGKIFNVCARCREKGLVDWISIDNFGKNKHAHVD